MDDWSYPFSVTLSQLQALLIAFGVSSSGVGYSHSHLPTSSLSSLTVAHADQRHQADVLDPRSCSTALVVTSYLLGLTTRGGAMNDRGISKLWQDFGTVTSDSGINWKGSGTTWLLFKILVANCALNCSCHSDLQRTFKCMPLADERSRYAYERKPLRVTDPTGMQRLTCRL